ncbi:MerC mercury resistance protein [Mesonia phycicola]|uniref:MerC mercury resistance protein n=1 Tax=Mesonia phycicola TaxID=579105 RepID=A0A1M6C468_9FLAO|nr:MerC domain-containing protein [Mesonia phycicola]SHI55826.1 MerC mercury resistance protein [Mesonia phycicola]
MKLTLKKPDTIGALTSALCVAHCLLTPFLFIAQTGSLHSINSVPGWWRSLDYFFLIISFFSIYQSTSTTSKQIIKYLLWFNWSLLSFLIINEKLEMLPLPELFTYVTAIALSGIHIYNLKYCQCKNSKCCSHG